MSIANLLPRYACQPRNIARAIHAYMMNMRSIPTSGRKESRLHTNMIQKSQNDCRIWNTVYSVFFSMTIGMKKSIYESAAESFSCAGTVFGICEDGVVGVSIYAS
jgi:hypothetical protein